MLKNMRHILDPPREKISGMPLCIKTVVIALKRGVKPAFHDADTYTDTEEIARVGRKDV